MSRNIYSSWHRWNYGYTAYTQSTLENNNISKQPHNFGNLCYIQQQNQESLKVIIKPSLRSRNIILISGYIRIIYDYDENKFNLVPNDIHHLIHLFSHKVDRYIYGIGYNTYGCFGVNGNRNNMNRWTFLAQFSALCYGSYYKINCGYQRFLIETQSNNVYVAGYNQYGASICNHNNTFNTTSITQFQFINNKLSQQNILKKIDIIITSNGIDSQHSFVVDSNDTIYAFGCNIYGQHGNGLFDEKKDRGNLNKINHFIPTKIDNSFCQNVGIKKIECGSDHSIFLLENGKMFSCGSNRFSQCGLESNYNTNIDDKQLILTPTEIKLNDFIMDIQCGSSHNLALNKSKQIYVFGKNTANQLAVSGNIEMINTPKLCIPFKTKKINIIQCGENHSLCIDDDGWCFLFGSNAYGQIGNGKGGKSWDSVDIPYQFNFKVIDGSASNHTVLLDDTLQNIYTFGNNNYNQCGIGGDTECHQPRNIQLSQFDENQYIVKVVASYQTTLVVLE